MKTPASKRIFFILYVLAMIAGAFALLEIGARAKYQESYLAGNVGLNRVFHHIIAPGTLGTMKSDGDFDSTYLTNNRGMRGPGDYAYEKKAGTVRVAVMGDSFTFGVGVETNQTFSALTAQKLEQLAPGRFEVLNFGMPSFSPALEYLYFKHEVVKYDPDILVLFMDSGDIHDDYHYAQRMVRDASGEIVACDPYVIHGRPDLWAIACKNSIFLTMMNEKLVRSILKIKKVGWARYQEDKRTHKRVLTDILTDPDLDNADFDRFILTREGKNPAIVRKHWAQTAEYLSMIHALCEQRKIPMVLVSYPCGQDIGATQWNKGREYWGFEPNRLYDPSAGYALVQEFADQNDIPFINLTGPLRDHASEFLYFNNDGHWTPRAHEIAAGVLADSKAFGGWSRAAAAKKAG